MQRKPLILAADVGGTKTYMGLFIMKAGSPEAVATGRFVNAGYRGIAGVIAAFLKKTKAGKGIAAACFGVACPVENNRGRLTNISWNVDGAALGRRFGIKKIALINDLVALGRGVRLLTRRDFFILQKGRAMPANAALIAAGTGLGEAILFWNGSERVPSASEGGHADFAPRSAIEVELFNHLGRKYGHVSYERIVSGPGLIDLYGFFRARSGKKEPARLRRRFKEEKDVAAIIFDEAVNGDDASCNDAFKLFVSVYGAEAGNLALKAMASGGVYLGGGIAPKVLAGKEAASVFRESFSAKGRFKEKLQTFPVYVIRNELAALYGAASYAAGLLEKRT